MSFHSIASIAARGWWASTTVGVPRVRSPRAAARSMEWSPYLQSRVILNMLILNMLHSPPSFTFHIHFFFFFVDGIILYYKNTVHTCFSHILHKIVLCWPAVMWLFVKGTIKRFMSSHSHPSCDILQSSKIEASLALLSPSPSLHRHCLTD